MRPLAAFAVLFLVAACQTAPPEMTEAKKAQIQTEVSEGEGALTDASERWDFNTYRGFLSSDFSWALSGQVHHSLDSWLELVRPALRGDTPSTVVNISIAASKC